jgi:hypothetical protein
LLAEQPVGRFDIRILFSGEPEAEIGGGAIFFSSAALDFINGQILYIDGG